MTPAPVVTSRHPSTVTLMPSPQLPLSLSPIEGPSMSPSVVLLLPSHIPSSVPTQPVNKSFSPASTKPTTTQGTMTSKPTVIDNITPPSAAPSLSLSNSMIMINDTFSILLFSVATKLDANSKTTFRNLTQGFLGDRLANRTQPIHNVLVAVVDQSLKVARQRQLVESLYPLRITMVIEGTFIPLQGSAQSAGDISLSLLCQELFDMEEYIFIGILQSSNDPTLSSVTSIQSVAKSGTSTAPAKTVSAPTFAPDTTPMSSNKGGLSLPFIIGIAVGAGVLTLAVLALLCYCCRRQPAMDGSSTKESTALSTVGPNRASLQPPNHMNSLVSEVPSFADTTTLNGMDNMSYAYSLDHGIEDQTSIGGQDQSTIGGYDSQSYQSSSVGHGRGGRMPMEIPNMSTSSVDTGDIKGKAQAALETKITRQCFAPPGKLGIVIDTTMQGPVVHKVNAGSPLEGVLWPGDIIVAIDEVDTRAMSASAITALMAKNMNKRRRLTILSDDK
jgi:hypothetical protein